MSIRDYIPNYLHSLAPIFTTRGRGGTSSAGETTGSIHGALAPEVDAMEADKDLAEEAKAVREWAAEKVRTFPTRERDGKVKWGTKQVEDWGDGIVKPLPDPTITRETHHERFARCRIGAQVYFWDPTTTWSDLVGKPRCPACGMADNVVGDGWPPKGGLLPVFKLEGNDWIYGKSYRHRGCPAKGEAGGDTTFNTLNSDFLQKLPPGIAAKFPGVRTRHQVVDKNLMYLLRFLREHEETVKIGEAIKMCEAIRRTNETMPGGAEGYSAFLQGLSRAHHGFASSVPQMVYPFSSETVHANHLQQYSASMNPIRIPTSHVLVQDAARAAAAQALVPKPRNRGANMTGKRKYCNTCLLHRSQETGHGRRSARCPYGERMAESKGGDLLPGKRLKRTGDK